jgi:hypothetical protein
VKNVVLTRVNFWRSRTKLFLILLRNNTATANSYRRKRIVRTRYKEKTG